MIKIIESNKTILESIIDDMENRVDKLIGKIAKYEYECGGNGLRLYFNDSPKKVRTALDVLDDEFDVTLGGIDGEYYYVKIKKYEPEDTLNKDEAPASEEVKSEEKYWVYKIEKDRELNGKSETDPGNAMYVDRSGEAHYQRYPDNRTEFTKDQAEAKINANNRKDRRYDWKMIPVSESVEITEDKSYYDDHESIRIKTITESYGGTYELGDSLDTMIGNLPDEEIDDVLDMYKVIAKSLDVKDYNRVIGVQVDYDYDPISIGNSGESIPSDKSRDLTKCHLDGVEFVREFYKPDKSTILYFRSEDDCNTFMNSMMSYTESKEDKELINDLKESYGLTEDQVNNIIKRVKESIDKEVK